MRQVGVRHWTNPSVLRFAAGANPMDAMIERVRTVVLKARDAGWSGPPFNPIALAKILDIPVDATAAVPDARTVNEGGRPRIEYNPQQARARARFSVAHEIAHTFFPDVGDAVRHRGGDTTLNDDWQLELLCNVAAAEMVMPIGSLPRLDLLPPLEQLIRDRLQYDVSVEAYLIRVVSVTEAPVTMFIASPRTSDGDYQYRVDYSSSSAAAPRRDVRELLVPQISVVRQCTAIGSTAKAVEDWFAGAATRIECVGVPGYPGTLLPRVVGLVRHTEADLGDFVHYIHGDILAPRTIPPMVVCQLTNDRAVRWGGGVARLMAQRYPNAETEYGEWIKRLSRAHRLGEVHFATTASGMVIASLVAQEGYGPGASRIRYHALDSCLRQVARYAFTQNASVHMPRIGTGGAGADWGLVEPLIRQNFEELEKGVWIYDLPPRRTQGELEL
jgi:O-acetyl-ADP-ribose deacetylase (regulator of RNase III)